MMKRGKLCSDADSLMVAKKPRNDEESSEEGVEKNNAAKGESKSDNDSSPTAGLSLNAKTLFKNIANLSAKIKQEPNESDIQTFAHHTMNELLGLYGYEKVAASDIDRLRPSQRTQKEETKRLLVRDSSSPSGSLTLKQSQPLLNYNDGDDVNCSWCGKTCQAAFTLQEDDYVKSFCSEKCFASCRRANFKKNKGCSSKSVDVPLTINGVNSLRASSVAKERKKSFLKDTTAQESHFEKGKLLFGKVNSHDKIGFDFNGELKTAGSKNKDKTAKTSDSFGVNRSPSNKFYQLFPDDLSKHSKPTSSGNKSGLTEKLAPTSSRKNEFINHLDSGIRRHSSESKHPRSSRKSTANHQPSLSFLSQPSFVNLFSPSMPLMGMSNVSNTLLENLKLDVDSFRLGMMAGCQQKDRFSNQTLENLSSLETFSSPGVSTSRNSAGSRTPTDGSQTSPVSVKESKIELDEGKARRSSKFNFNFKYNENKQTTLLPFSCINPNLPFPLLLIPFPVPVPIPIPIPSIANFRSERLPAHSATPPVSSQYDGSVSSSNIAQEAEASNSAAGEDSFSHKPCHIKTAEALDKNLPSCSAIDLSTRSRKQGKPEVQRPPTINYGLLADAFWQNFNGMEVESD